MKRGIIISLLALFANVNLCYSSCEFATENKKVVVDVYRKNTGTSNKYERSLSIPNVEVFYDNDLHQVCVELFDVGVADVYIVNANGIAIDSSTVETSNGAITYLSTISCAEDFYVVVDSDYIYAEGYVCK